MYMVNVALGCKCFVDISSRHNRLSSCVVYTINSSGEGVTDDLQSFLGLPGSGESFRKMSPHTPSDSFIRFDLYMRSWRAYQTLKASEERPG